MTIKAVLFDIDGTLVDSNDLHVRAWAEVFATVGQRFDNQAIQNQIGKGADLLVPALLPGADEAESKRLGELHGEIFKSRYLHRVKAFPGARDMVLRVHATGRRVVFASSASREELEHYLDLLDVRGVVAAMTTAEDVTTTKPAPDIFMAALAKVAPLKPDEAVVIGDTPYDAAAARACGIAAVGVRSGGFSDAELRAAGMTALYDDVAGLLAEFDTSLLGTGGATTSRPAARDPARPEMPPGHDAASPFAVPASGWREVLVRTWREAGDDNVSLLAAGVAFYGFLAMVPLLGAIVLSYGLIADPATVMADVRALTSVMPADAAKLIGEQLLNVVTTSGDKKGFGLLLALLLALYGAMKGAGAVITALNVVYEEKETRGFVRLNLVTLVITIGAVLTAIFAMIAIAALGHLDTMLPGAPAFLLVAGKLTSYALLAAAGAAGAATLYRYAPDRDAVRWIWLTPGSVAVTLLWLALTLGFGAYVANFGNYDATYGSLGAVVVLLTWLYLSAYILMMGAELNAELEHQTATDTTPGPARPLGARGAEAADTVAAQTPVHTSSNRSSDHPADAGDAGSPSAMRDMLASGAAWRVMKTGGWPTAPLIPALLATAGLSLVRQRGRAALGASIIAAGAALAWLQRAPDKVDEA